MRDAKTLTASVFHIGYVKTGTTTLQKEVFDREDLGCAWAGGDAAVELGNAPTAIRSWRP